MNEACQWCSVVDGHLWGKFSCQQLSLEKKINSCQNFLGLRMTQRKDTKWPESESNFNKVQDNVINPLQKLHGLPSSVSYL